MYRLEPVQGGVQVRTCTGGVQVRTCTAGVYRFLVDFVKFYEKKQAHSG